MSHGPGPGLTAPPSVPPSAPSSAPAGLGDSAFGNSVFNIGQPGQAPARTDGVASASAPAWNSEAPTPDLCQVGAVLRSVLFVEAVLAIGALLLADGTGAAAWLLTFSSATGVAVPGVLLWQVAACALRPRLRRRAAWAQASTMAALGAVAGAAAWLLHAYAVGDAAGRWPGAALAGAGFAAVIVEQLRLRAKARAPAATAARLAELQSRIRPHFLFNALNTALSLVRADPLRAEGVLEDLAELFRGALADDGGGDRTASVGEEIQLAQRYLAIEQTRFGDRLRIAWDLDPAAERARLPPLVLQPLVENAVRHGVEASADGGAIRVRTQTRHGRAVISIVNTVPPLAGLPGHGIALRNVRERLHLLHDVAAQFDAGLGEDGMFRVRIVVPLAP